MAGAVCTVLRLGGVVCGGGEGKDRLGGVRCVGIEVCVCSVLWVCG